MVIGIVTLMGYVNYGNRLQNYALTRLLESEGFEVINGIEVYVKKDWIKKSHNVIKRFVKLFIPFYFVKDKLYTPTEPKNELLKKRSYCFKKFCETYTHDIEPIIASNYLSVRHILSKKYNIDYYIAGSDQVWNPYYEGKEYEFLCFAEKRKRLSFAASISADDIPDKLTEYYKKHLKRMKYISVREERSASIIKKLINKDVDVTMDPTLLLPLDEWNKIIKKPNVSLEGEYICTYFLGEEPTAVQEFIKRKHLCVHKLNSYDEEELFTINPAEFLFMIKNAKYILTDSFHGVAFSIKFNKDFYVFRREQKNVNDMFSRIEYILNKFDISNRIQDRNSLIEQKTISNWNEIELILNIEREKSIDKLKREMNG